MPFKPTTPEPNTHYLVKAHLIKDNSNEFIINVFHHGTIIGAYTKVGVNEALDKTRELAKMFDCKYEFASFPKSK